MRETVTATFLFTDLVGSTRLRDRLGDDVADAVTALHDEIVRTALAVTGGVEVKSLGDGIMAFFESAADAVICALHIQDAVAAADPPPGARLEIRVGVNAGEVVRQDGDYTGLPVAVASRVCGAAEGGQILTTRVVRTLVGSRGGFTFTPVGARILKGIDQPVELFTVATGDRAAAVPADAGTIPFPPMLERTAATTLVGREDAALALDAALEVVRSGRRHLAMVAGEPGIGKTAFVSVWCRAAARRGATVIAGRSPLEAVAPYQPFVEAARQVLMHRPSLVEHLGPGASHLGRLVPDLAHVLPGSSAVRADPGTERYLLFESFVALLGAATGDGVLVLLLDDLHWADEPSLALLDYTVRHPDETAVLILGTYRDTDLSRAHPLSRLLSDMRREKRVERILLRSLDEGDTARLIAARTGATPPPAVARSVYRETEGNPFFIEEVLAHLQEAGAIDAGGTWRRLDEVEAYGIPEGIREVLGMRLDRLRQGTNEMLSVAAVIGREFDVPLLERVTGEDLVVIEDGLEEAVRSGLVVEEGGAPGRFSFSHALIRQLLYEEMPATRRARLHRTVAAALESGGGSPGELAHHWTEGMEPMKALGALVQAARAAEEVAAFDDARRHLDLALEIWDEVDDPEAAAAMSHPRLLLFAAQMQNQGGSGDRSIALARRALDEVDRDRDPHLTGALLERLARYLWVAGHGPAALAAGHEAVAVIPDDPPSEERARALAAVAGLEMLSSRYDRAARAADGAIAIARRVGARPVEAHALVTLGTVLGSTGEVESGAAMIREGQAIAEEEHAVDDLLRSYSNLSSILATGGRLEESAAVALEGLEMARSVGLMDSYGWFQAANAAEALIDLGRWDEADAALGGPGAGGGVPVSRMNVLLGRTRLALLRGDLGGARAYLDEREELGRMVVDPQFVAPFHHDAAVLARLEGRLPDALETIREGIKAVQGSESWYYSAPLYVTGIGVVADLAGRGEADRDVIAEAESWWSVIESAPDDHADAAARRATARADVALIRGEDSVPFRKKAVAAWDAVGRAFDGALARWRLGRALAAAGELDAAKPDLEAARLVADRLGAWPLVTAIAATLEGPATDHASSPDGPGPE